MRANDLMETLLPFRAVCETRSLVAEYKLINILPDRLSARTARLALDARIELGLDKPCAVEAAHLIGVVSSLPGGDDLVLTLQDGVLDWRCNAAHGRLATQPPRDPPPLPEPAGVTLGLDRVLGETLFELGTLSCGHTVLASVGLFGAAILTANGRVWCISSDNVTVSVAGTDCTVEIPRCTIGANEATAFAAFAERNGRIGFEDQRISYADDRFSASAQLLPPLKHDLWGLASAYMHGEVVTALDKDRVMAFVKRAAILAEHRGRCLVQVEAASNRITLRFAEAVAEAQEYYLIDQCAVPEPYQVTVDATRLSRALQHCDEIILDHMARRVLGFRAKSGNFHYIISGRSEEQ
jgi:hypothetical protein